MCQPVRPLALQKRANLRKPHISPCRTHRARAREQAIVHVGLAQGLARKLSARTILQPQVLTQEHTFQHEHPKNFWGRYRRELQRSGAT